ncbi:MAG: ABC transporter permease [Polyangiales bacterium]
MNNILLIVRRELMSYLRTPSGYIIAASILLINGLLFNTRAVGSTPRFSSEVLQQFLIDAGGTTMLAAVLFSMRLLAEERAGGTQTLLFTSPIRESEIVVGKYLASLSFLAVLVLLSLYLPALIFVNGKVSLGHVAAGYGGMILLGASTLAVGLFASSLVKNQFFAVILAAVFVTTLELCWWIAQVTDPPFTSLIAYMAPYMKHFHPFRRGMVQLSDIVFYASVVYLSLLAATRVLQSQRWQ